MQKDDHLVAVFAHDIPLAQSHIVVIVPVANGLRKHPPVGKDADSALCWQLRAVDECAAADGVIEPSDAIGQVRFEMHARNLEACALPKVLRLSEGPVDKVANIIKFSLGGPFVADPGRSINGAIIH